MMKFVPAYGEALLSGVSIYRPDEYSFDFDPRPSSIYSMAVVNDLTLDVDRDGKILSISGFCPYMSWIAASLTPPKSRVGEVRIQADPPFCNRIAIGLSSERYLVFFERAKQLVKVQIAPKATTAIEISAGLIIEIDDESELCSLWLRPASGLTDCQNWKYFKERVRQP